MKEETVSACLIEACPVSSALAHVGGKWKLAIIWQLNKKEYQRFSELRRSIPEISERVFIREIKHMEQSGLVERIDHQEVPPKVEYRLAQSGKELLPILDQLSQWSTRHGFHNLGENGFAS